MRASQNILLVIATLTLNRMFSFVGSTCDNGILNLLGFTNDSHIFVSTSDVRNQSLLKLLNNTRTERRRRAIDSPSFSGSTSYFEIIGDDVIILSCPPIGETGVFEIVLDLSMFFMQDCGFDVTYTIVPTEPDILMPNSSSVVASSSVGDVDVIEFTIANEGPCTNFKCSVTCGNEEKTFWVTNGTRMIRTHADDIIHYFVYKLILTCAEHDHMNGMIKSSAMNVSVSFLSESSLTTGNYQSVSPFIVTFAATSSTAQSTLLIYPPVLVFLVLLVIVCFCCDP